MHGVNLGRCGCPGVCGFWSFACALAKLFLILKRRSELEPEVVGGGIVIFEPTSVRCAVVGWFFGGGWRANHQLNDKHFIYVYMCVRHTQPNLSYYEEEPRQRNLCVVVYYYLNDIFHYHQMHQRVRGVHFNNWQINHPTGADPEPVNGKLNLMMCARWDFLSPSLGPDAAGCAA